VSRLCWTSAELDHPATEGRNRTSAHTALADAERIATDATTYSLDPADYADVRGLVAQAIEGLPPAR
jgi:hypothetical protein